MKKISIGLFLLTLSFLANAELVKGIVVIGERGCAKRDYIIISLNSGYVYAQQYRGSFDKGDEVIGELNSYGFKDVLVNSSSGRIWIDDYMLSKSRATDKCFGN